MRRLCHAFIACLLAGAMACAQAAEPPQDLRDTGYRADGMGVLRFAPQYPLWSDGADKQRQLRLPAGQTIDARDPDAWRFPVGTRFWKTFSHEGRAVETRYMARERDGSWTFATYVWSEDGRSATLAPARGTRLAVRGAPGGRYNVPSRSDCMACHGSTTVPVLGFSALQLSADRDPLAAGSRPLAPGELTLANLQQRGLLRHGPAALRTPPRIAGRSALERAALGYLHGNCGHCHNGSEQRVPVRLTLAQSVADPAGSHQRSLQSAVDAFSRYRPPGSSTDWPVISPGDSRNSVLALRLQSRHPQVQMPPLATEVPDPEGLALVLHWIDHDLTPTSRKEAQP